MIQIYKVTNKINGKAYVGQTSRPLKERWRQHCADTKRKFACYKFQKAILEHGKENFEIEQIDTAKTKAEANEKEIHWIKYFDTANNGYNVSKGGNLGGSGKRVKAVESGLVFESLTAAAKHYGVATSGIGHAVDRERVKIAGQHWISC